MSEEETAVDLPLDINLPNLALVDARTTLPSLFTPANIPRIRSINVGLAAYGAPALLAGLLIGNFTKLETLIIRCWEPQSYEIEWDDPEEAALHPTVSVSTLGIQHAPKLTRVALQNCLLLWNADIYSQLTHLEISVGGEAYITDAQRPTHHQLHSIIASMPALEELYLGIFPHYANAMLEQQAIAVPPGSQRVTLRSPDAFLNRHCYRLAASLVVPPHARLVIKQACAEDADLLVAHFAGLEHPPRALSLRTGLDIDETSMGEVIIPFDSTPWLEAPANLLSNTPGGYVCLQFAFDFGQGAEGEDEENGYNALFTALSRIHYGQLRLLRVDGLRDEEHIERLMFGGEDDPDLDQVNMLSGASNLEVLVASLTYPREELLAAIIPGEPPFPLLHTIHQE